MSGSDWTRFDAKRRRLTTHLLQSRERKNVRDRRFNRSVLGRVTIFSAPTLLDGYTRTSDQLLMSQPIDVRHVARPHSPHVDTRGKSPWR